MTITFVIISEQINKPRGGVIISQNKYFEYLLDTYQNLVYSICYKSTGNSFDAEDLTQEVFISAYKSLPDFDGKYEKAWLCKIAANRCVDFLKQAGRRCLPTEDIYFQALPDAHASPERSYLEQESKEQVLALCEKLRPPYDTIAKEHFCCELSAKQIAAKYQENIKTVQTRIYRAKAMLKKMLERSD